MSNQPNNKQVSIMAIACVTVIAITMMVLTAMMNVASAQDVVKTNYEVCMTAKARVKSAKRALRQADSRVEVFAAKDNVRAMKDARNTQCAAYRAETFVLAAMLTTYNPYYVAPRVVIINQ